MNLHKYVINNLVYVNHPSLGWLVMGSYGWQKVWMSKGDEMRNEREFGREVLKAWDLAVAGFREGRPEVYKDLNSYMNREWGIRAATREEMRAFDLLDEYKLKYPYRVSVGL